MQAYLTLELDHLCQHFGVPAIAAIDVETTGTNPELDRIVSMALVRVDRGGNTWELVSAINPGIPIPPEATAIHGLADADVAHQLAFAAHADAVRDLLTGAIVVAYNGRFDLRCLAAEYRRLSRDGDAAAILSMPLLDPCAIFMQREKRDLAAALQFYCEETHAEAHDSLADAVAAVQVLVAQLAWYADLPTDAAALVEYCARRDPSWLDRDGKIRWQNGEARVAFGKNSGRSLRELAKTDAGFLRWIDGKYFADDTKALVRQALAGTFPAMPAALAAGAETVNA